MFSHSESVNCFRCIRMVFLMFERKCWYKCDLSLQACACSQTHKSCPEFFFFCSSVDGSFIRRVSKRMQCNTDLVMKLATDIVIMHFLND